MFCSKQRSRGKTGRKQKLRKKNHHGRRSFDGGHIYLCARARDSEPSFSLAFVFCVSLTQATRVVTKFQERNDAVISQQHLPHICTPFQIKVTMISKPSSSLVVFCLCKVFCKDVLKQRLTYKRLFGCLFIRILDYVFHKKSLHFQVGNHDLEFVLKCWSWRRVEKFSSYCPHRNHFQECNIGLCNIMAEGFRSIYLAFGFS